MAELVDALLRRHEDKTLEFKLDLSSPDRVVASIVAFANAAGGVVLIGVEDNSRTVRGLPEPTEAEERLANLVSDRIAPGLLVDISIVPWRGHSLVMAEVYPSVRRPHHDRALGVERGTFVRIGSSNRLADESLRAELARGATETFDETPLASAVAADIDADFAGRLLHRGSLSEADLVALRAIDGRGDRRTATVGGYLLFRRDPEPRLMPDAWLHAGRFSSGDRTQIADSKRINGRLTEIVDADFRSLIARWSPHIDSLDRPPTMRFDQYRRALCARRSSTQSSTRTTGSRVRRSESLFIPTESRSTTQASSCQASPSRTSTQVRHASATG